MLALLWSGGALRLAGATAPAGPAPVLRLVQGNVAQHHKWQPELRAQWFRRHLDLSAQGADGVQAVIWPESATPYAIDQEPEVRRLIGQVVPPGGLLLTGGERFDFDSAPARAWNSLFVLDPGGTVVTRYDKRDLVPFGEFLPARGLLGRLGLQKVTGGSVDFQPGPGRQTIALPGLPPFSPLICYEAIFPGGVVEPGARPAWLLNVTNDAWFGRSSGPYQHLAMARLRAVEEGLPLVRAANTGISAVVDPWGRIAARLDLGVTGVLDAALPAPLAAPPPFARLGLRVVAALAALAGATMMVAEIRAARRAREVNKSAKSATTSSGHAGL
jgi:apolipoprotein N-acyltransferase